MKKMRMGNDLPATASPTNTRGRRCQRRRAERMTIGNRGMGATMNNVIEMPDPLIVFMKYGNGAALL